MEKVLFVDDDPRLLNAYARRTKSLRRIPLLADNRAAAVEIARHHRPSLAVVDLVLRANDNGLNVVRQLRDQKSPMTIILVSGSMCVHYAMEGVAAGADDCFGKPVTVEQLIARAEVGRRGTPPQAPPTLAEIEWEYIVRTLAEHGGNRSAAARVLGISRMTLLRKIAEHGSGVIRPDIVRRTSATKT